jgi:hypothetical protein
MVNLQKLFEDEILNTLDHLYHGHSEQKEHLLGFIRGLLVTHERDVVELAYIKASFPADRNWVSRCTDMDYGFREFPEIFPQNLFKEV